VTRSVDQLLEEARALLPDRPSPEDVRREMDRGADQGVLVIDIRGDEQQRRDGLIPGALVIRRNVLEWRCDPASPWHHPSVTSHDQRIVVVCDEGYQSSLAAANLQRLGLLRATDMDGGFQAWRAAGLPVAPYAEEATRS
jgi:rhodanese-related sulfurtransferase